MTAVGLRSYLGLLRAAETQLADALTLVSDRHSANAEVRDTARLLARWSRGHVEALAEPIARHGVRRVSDPARLRAGLLQGERVGGLGVVRDVNDLLALATYTRGAWLAVFQAAMELHDVALAGLCTSAGADADRQIAWLKTRLRLAAPQALTVPPDQRAQLRAAIPKTPTPAALPELAWAPLASAALLLVTGLLGLLAGQPWLLPSLGPTAYLLAESPAHPASRAYNVVAGHLLGLAAGIVAVLVTGASSAPGVLQTGQITGVRVAAATIALGLTLAATLALRASHPPAGATTLLVALGALRTPGDLVNVAVGAAILAVVGIAVRRLRLGRWPRRDVTHAAADAGPPSATQPVAAELEKAA